MKQASLSFPKASGFLRAARTLVIPALCCVTNCANGATQHYGDNPFEAAALAHADKAKSAITFVWLDNPAESEYCATSRFHLGAMKDMITKTNDIVDAGLRSGAPPDEVGYAEMELRFLRLLHKQTEYDVNETCKVISPVLAGTERHSFNKEAAYFLDMVQRKNDNQTCYDAREGLSNLESAVLSNDRKKGILPDDDPVYNDVLRYNALVERRCMGENWMNEMKSLVVTNPDALKNAASRLRVRVLNAAP